MERSEPFSAGADPIPDLLRPTDTLRQRYPGLGAAAWLADVLPGAEPELPALGETARASRDAAARATNMSQFFRATGSGSSSPVEFQIAKARDGSMDYSRRVPLVDLLLYAEVATGLIIGLHDVEALSLPVRFGLGRDADTQTFLHISQREHETKDAEPALISAGQVIASLIHGPDRATMVTAATTRVWGVVFSAPDDPAGALAEALSFICDGGEQLGLWRVLARTAL